MLFFFLGLHFGLISMYIVAPLVAIVAALMLRDFFSEGGVWAVMGAIIFSFLPVGFGACTKAITTTSRYHHGYSDDTVRTVKIISMVLGAIAVGCMIYSAWHSSKNKEREAAAQAEKAKEKEQRELEIEEFYRTKYGEETERFEGVGMLIRVFRKARKVVIKGRPYDFDDLMWCDINEEDIFIPGYSNTNITVKPRTSSALKGALITGLTGNLGWGLARTLGDVDIDSRTTGVPDRYKTKYTVTIAVFDKDKPDNKREFTYITSSEERAHNLQDFIHKIMFEYNAPEDE